MPNDEVSCKCTIIINPFFWLVMESYLKIIHKLFLLSTFLSHLKWHTQVGDETKGNPLSATMNSKRNFFESMKITCKSLYLMV